MLMTLRHSCPSDTQTIISELKFIANKLFHWFQYNHLKDIPGKSYLLLSSKTSMLDSTDDVSLTASSKEPVFRISFDSELSFDYHVFSICSKASKKLQVPGRTVNFMSFEKRRRLLKTFIESQFNYCPPIRMFHSRTMNNKINRIHEGALRLVYFYHVSSLDKLLKKDKSSSIHHMNIRKL